MDKFGKWECGRTWDQTKYHKIKILKQNHTVCGTMGEAVMCL